MKIMTGYYLIKIMKKVAKIIAPRYTVGKLKIKNIRLLNNELFSYEVRIEIFINLQGWCKRKNVGIPNSVIENHWFFF